MFTKIILTLIFLYIPFTQYSQLNNGKWRGLLHYKEAKVPFTFHIDSKGRETNMKLINGLEERRLNEMKFDGDSVKIPLGVFDANLFGHYSNDYINGEWVKHYKDYSIKFEAFHNQSRFKKNQTVHSAIDSVWSITFKPADSDPYPGIGLFQEKDGNVRGTIMTEVSDFRYFEGILDGDSIKLSSFDGTHGFGFYGKRTETKWKGILHFDYQYSESWEAVYDSTASLQDPFEIIDLTGEKYKPYYDILSIGSGYDIIDTSRYAGKVLIIQIFGTWCPNSYDQTKYLVEWYKNDKPENLEILASSFEPNYSKSYGLRRINEYKNDMDIPYEVVLGGRLSKTQAAMPFPFMDRIVAFPTLVFVGRDGYVKKVLSYFNGPATGYYYKQFVKKFEALVDELTK